MPLPHPDGRPTCCLKPVRSGSSPLSAPALRFPGWDLPAGRVQETSCHIRWCSAPTAEMGLDIDDIVVSVWSRAAKAAPRTPQHRIGCKRARRIGAMNHLHSDRRVTVGGPPFWRAGRSKQLYISHEQSPFHRPHESTPDIHTFTWPTPAISSGPADRLPSAAFRGARLTTASTGNAEGLRPWSTPVRNCTAKLWPRPVAPRKCQLCPRAIASFASISFFRTASLEVPLGHCRSSIVVRTNWLGSGPALYHEELSNGLVQPHLWPSGPPVDPFILSHQPLPQLAISGSPVHTGPASARGNK